ncbi:rha family phage regulatory protein [Enterococcus phoeniculicola]|uniref:Rha family phage regulatory protein n=1 Tax=Enterococcus phoeniculicola ATCC BAA-412 TaxID=1158610 RepID=R3WJI7_9ENTE|nr:Rha family transcriptional regulator [Enterococcus phoeniculicola]EOL42035.1 rha family phage regulatory protein [Enterococcus phoeniculicola ATCC BAA-412]EOT79686.1 hypothetical protein I589_01198 [Enterococcus phoeniculicola ATCC BAA-412]OJG71752.1 rha family phage regulatory protein [Enterococcus phoeniculicola]
MNQLQQTLTSNEVAEMIGTTNGELMKSIRIYISYLAEGKIPSGDFFIESTYKDSNNQMRPNYLLTKQGCEMVSNKLTGPKGVQFTAKYVSRFNQMENHIKQQVQIDTTPRGLAKLALAASEETNERVDALADDVLYLKEDAVLAVGDYNTVSDRVNKRVSEVAKAYGITTRKGRSALFKDINGGVKQITGVGRRTQLRKKHYEQVMEYINDWEPSTATRTIIRQMELDNEDIA